VLTAWTYLTPLFYPAALWPEWLAKIEQFNPMHHYVAYFRDIMLYGTTPSALENLVCVVFAMATFAVGYLVFRKTENKFILHL
ncbi:MAG: ABC transporter permease, partial [Eggerthellaceae bacterium]|nr:ABC transporter permease [Eggerthellaceae bacterium]